MNGQPEALRLAEELDAYHTRSCHKEAAAELRRLHEENEELNADIESWRMALAAATTLGEKVTAENERLREVLAKCVDAARDCALQHRIAADSMYDQAEAALRREEKT